MIARSSSIADVVGDCEADRGGWWAQDVNAWTSLPFVAVGLVVVVEVIRRRLPRAVLALAALTAFEGVGSLLFHGRPNDLAQLLHDVSLLGMLGYVAGWHLGRLRGQADAAALVGAAIASVFGAMMWQLSEAITSPAAGLLVALIVVAELLRRKHSLPAVWSGELLVLTGVALAAWVLGRSDSPLCRPDSWLQPHGVWHATSALVILLWIDRAYGSVMTTPPRMARRAVDRGFGLLARVAAHAFHRSLDVVHRDRIPRHQPVLIVANHANGFVDPILVASLLGRLPRFLGKAALWKVLPARPLLAFAGVLPVYRAGDGDRPGDNLSTFSATDRELAAGATVAIFPEGTTGDRGGLDRVRTGAARIAIGALHTAPDLVVVPIGMGFESRIETRSRAVVMVGRPILVADIVTAPHPEPGQEPDHDDVCVLTAAITQALGEVAPDYETTDERDLLRAAARTTIVATSTRGEPSFGAVEERARCLANSSTEHRERIFDAYRRYATRLHLMGARDRDVRRSLPGMWRLALSVLALLLFGPFIVTVSLVHAPAIVVVVGATALVRSTATKGTVRVLVGVVMGLATWFTVGVIVADGPAVLVVAAATAISGWVVLALWTTIVGTVQSVWGSVRRRDRIGLLSGAVIDRDRLVDAVTTAERSIAPVDAD